LFLSPPSIYRKPQMSLLLKPGHKINKPMPLFTKIEQTRVDELKAKYGGTQQPAVKETKVEKSKFFSTVEEAEKAVADQAEKVRKLKTGGVEKSVWQPEVNILLELKKQVEGLKKTQTTTPAAAPSADDIKKVEAEITEQVRPIDA
jgi:methionyl-tRNA synthetase